MVCANSRRKRLSSGRGSAAVALEAVQAERYLAPIPARAQDGHQDPCSSLSPSLQGTQKSQKIRKSRLESPALRAPSSRIRTGHNSPAPSALSSPARGLGRWEKEALKGPQLRAAPLRLRHRGRRRELGAAGQKGFLVFGVAKLRLILLASGSGLGDHPVGCVHV